MGKGNRVRAKRRAQAQGVSGNSAKRARNVQRALPDGSTMRVDDLTGMSPDEMPRLRPTCGDCGRQAEFVTDPAAALERLGMPLETFSEFAEAGARPWECQACGGFGIAGFITAPNTSD